jgi:hypothetical protein
MSDGAVPPASREEEVSADLGGVAPAEPQTSGGAFGQTPRTPDGHKGERRHGRTVMAMDRLPDQPRAMPRSEKIGERHLERLAVVYVRQSTVQQIVDHRESTNLQYGLVDRAVALGWPEGRVLLIDEDQGKSGARLKVLELEGLPEQGEDLYDPLPSVASTGKRDHGRPLIDPFYVFGQKL